MIRTDYTQESLARYQDRLSPRYFAVLMASTAGDYRAIAEGLGINMGTVKSRLHRARKALADVRAKETADAS
jgi:DNA-directed RNA polymerase specialized sigma24 family protein